MRTRDAALVGIRALEHNRWKLGDTVTLHSTVFPVELEFRIVGTIPGKWPAPRPRVKLPIFWFQRDYLVEALQAKGIAFDSLGNIWARVDDPAKVPAVMDESTRCSATARPRRLARPRSTSSRASSGLAEGFLVCSWR